MGMGLPGRMGMATLESASIPAVASITTTSASTATAPVARGRATSATGTPRRQGAAAFLILLRWEISAAFLGRGTVLTGGWLIGVMFVGPEIVGAILLGAPITGAILAVIRLG